MGKEKVLRKQVIEQLLVRKHNHKTSRTNQDTETMEEQNLQNTLRTKDNEEPVRKSS